MADKICYPIIEVPAKDVIKAEVPSGATLNQGDVMTAESLISGSLSVYQGAQVTDITADEPVIVINQGVYEDSDGSRPAGHPNVGEITYAAESVITAIRLEKDLLFFISNDALDNTGVVAPAAGVFLIPQNSDYQLATSATVGTAITALKIEAVTTVPVGKDFVDGVYARVTLGR